ncbi:MAG TPA: hypothetical protein PLN52_22710 [Opitutaceae bacterium]|nr:hypothetical protein [Opitutaceae bacterium]
MQNPRFQRGRMTTEFLTPRFVGPRFHSGTLPLAVARDLAAYEDLVRELAKSLYLKENSGRRRVPKGFDAAFSLHLREITDGSSKPHLVRVVAGAVLAAVTGADYFEQARDLIAVTVTAVADSQPIPESFDKKLLSRFNNFGASLKAGEYVDLAPPSFPPAHLTLESRKRLVLAGAKVYTRELVVTGEINEVDFRTRTFRMRELDDRTFRINFDPQYDEMVRSANGRNRVVVHVRAVGHFDAHDTLEGPLDIQELTFFNNLELFGKIEGLLDYAAECGQESTLNVTGLYEVAELICDTFPDEVPLPLVAHTPDCNLFFEWIRDTHRVSAETNLSTKAITLQYVDLQTGNSADMEADLSSEGLAKFYEFIAKWV